MYCKHCTYIIAVCDECVFASYCKNCFLAVIKYLFWDECVLRFIANACIYFILLLHLVWDECLLLFIANTIYYIIIISRLRWVSFAIYCKPYKLYCYYISFEMSVLRFIANRVYIILLFYLIRDQCVFCNCKPRVGLYGNRLFVSHLLRFVLVFTICCLSIFLLFIYPLLQ